MEYVVLARKLRPMRFQDLVGQETVARILRNAIVQGRVAHAFLFAGSRGVGKTSAARILTKALNCEQPQDGEPCNACANCREITANASPDIYEIDAASNRGIDNIRELRENTNYRPAKNRYKTYIIDEAHMLTMESFNALLKTLEEPPAQVKFILATTNPHKIPDTIQSRCQRFDFGRIPMRAMSEYLQRVIGDEGLTLSRTALDAIARNAAGGMRDALTAIDQVVAFAGSAPSDADVLNILGLMDSREVVRLLDAVLGANLDDALATFAAVVERGHDMESLLASLLQELKDLSLFVTLRRESIYFQDHAPEALEFYARHATGAAPDRLQQLFYLFLDLESQLRRTVQTRACFEMALAKACRVESLVGVPDLLAGVKALLATPEAAPPRSRATPPTAAEPVPDRSGQEPARPTAHQSPQAAALRSRHREAQPARETGRAPAADAEEPEPAAELGAAPPAGPLTEPAGTSDPARDLAPHADTDAEAGADQADPDALPPLPEFAWCDDPRFAAFAEHARTASATLAARLRRTEVAEITATRVLLAPPSRSESFTEGDLERLRPALREAFGEAFDLALIDATNRGARAEFTQSGRERLAAAHQAARERQRARDDPQVRRIARFFPRATVKHVQLREPAAGDHDDV